MAKIDVYPEQMTDLAAKLKSTEKLLSEARQLVAIAQTELTMQVASREGINGKMAAANKKIAAQCTKTEQMASAATLAADEFADADRMSGEKAKSIFAKILGGLTKFTGTVGHFLASIRIKQHKAAAEVFLPAGSILGGAGLAAVIGALGGSGRHDGSGVGSSGLGHGSGNGGHGGTSAAADMPTQGKPPTQTAISTPTVNNADTQVKPPEQAADGLPGIAGGALKSYDTAAFQSVAYNKKGYADYALISGVTTACCLSQKDKQWFTNEKGEFDEKSYNIFAKKGCLSTSDAMIQKIKNGKNYNPKDTFDFKEMQSRGLKSQKITGTKDYSLKQTYAELYKQINNGNPVVIKVQSDTAGQHFVAVVGIRKDADPKNLSDADFLIIDPQEKPTGKIKSLSERATKKAKNLASEILLDGKFSLRIPK